MAQDDGDKLMVKPNHGLWWLYGSGFFTKNNPESDRKQVDEVLLGWCTLKLCCGHLADDGVYNKLHASDPPKPSFLQFATHILEAQRLHFSGSLGGLWRWSL